MNTRGVLRLLLVAHARNRNVERAEQVKAELDANRFEYSGAMYAQLMEMYTAAGHLDKAMDIMAKAKSVDSAFSMDAYKVINLAALLVQKDKMTEAVALLDDFGRKNDRPLEFDAVERNFVRLLNAAADKGDVAGVQTLWEKILALAKVQPTNPLCGPLVKVHLVNNDIPGRELEHFLLR